MKHLSIFMQQAAGLIIIASVLSVVASAHDKERKAVSRGSIVPNENTNSEGGEGLIPTLKPLSIPTTSALIKPLIAVLLFDEEYGGCCDHGHSYCVPTPSIPPVNKDCILEHEGVDCLHNSNGG